MRLILFNFTALRLYYYETSESKLFDKTKSFNSHNFFLTGRFTLCFLYFSLILQVLSDGIIIFEKSKFQNFADRAFFMLPEMQLPVIFQNVPKA